jgi:hypothetical protein
MSRVRPALISLGSAWFGFIAPASVRASEVHTAPSSPPDTSSDCVRERRFHADFELDPTAYALDGFSLHVGLGWNALRFDLGVFGLRVPEFVHQQPDFDVAFDGYGVKVQFFPFAEQRGAFVGVDAAYSRSLVRLQSSQLLSARDSQLAVGVNAGFRFDVVGALYLTPWLGMGYAFGADDAQLGSETFRANPLIVFPAVHLGYRLR